jgi:hypothetical protein
VIEPSQWERLVVPGVDIERHVIQVAQDGIPDDWLRRHPLAVVGGTSVFACRYTRTVIAEHIRTSVILAERDPEVTELMIKFDELNRLVGLFDARFLDLANGIDDGTLRW